MPGRPKEQLLRCALRHWAFVVPGPDQRELPAEDRLVLQWVVKASRPLVDLHDPVLARDVLESLRRKLDGGEAAVETMRRKRKVFVHALHYAVERGELGSQRRLLRGRLPAGPWPSGWSGSSPACTTRGCGRRRRSRWRCRTAACPAPVGGG